MLSISVIIPDPYELSANYNDNAVRKNNHLKKKSNSTGVEKDDSLWLSTIYEIWETKDIFYDINMRINNFNSLDVKNIKEGSIDAQNVATIKQLIENGKQDIDFSLKRKKEVIEALSELPSDPELAEKIVFYLYKKLYKKIIFYFYSKNIFYLNKNNNLFLFKNNILFI